MIGSENITANYFLQTIVEQYLTVLHESDKALEYLIDYFKNVDRDVVILFYGDHHPKLNAEFYEEVHGGSFDSLDEQMMQYTVPFFIWTNYDIEDPLYKFKLFIKLFV